MPGVKISQKGKLRFLMICIPRNKVAVSYLGNLKICKKSIFSYRFEMSFMFSLQNLFKKAIISNIIFFKKAPSGR